MGYIVKNGQIVKAHRIVGLSPIAREELLTQTAKQKEIKKKILERKKLFLKKSA